MKRALTAAIAFMLAAAIVGGWVVDYANVHGWLSHEWSQKLCFGQKECLKAVERRTAGRP